MGQQRIKQGEFRIDHIGDGQVVLYQVFEETDRLLACRVTDRFIEHEVFVGIDCDVVETVEVEPLAHESLKEGLCLGVRQHSVDVFR